LWYFETSVRLARFVMLLRSIVVIAITTGATIFASDASEKVLNVYNWADYIGETTVKNFEDEYGIKVNYDVYDSAQIVDAKLMAGKSGYDVVVHAASNSARLIPIGVFRQLDKSQLSNWDKLDPILLTNFAKYDPGNQYGVPYMWGTTGFTYNADMVTERMPNAPIGSSQLIFDPDTVSKFADCGVTMLDSASEVIGMAMLYLGHDSNSVVPEHLAQAEELLRSIRPYVKYFSSTKLLLDLPSKEVCIAMSWSGDYSVASRRAADAGIDVTLGYTIPVEGSLIWFDVAYIPAGANNVRGAHLFLDFIMRPEVIAEVSDFIGYANANREASALMDVNITSDPAIYPDEITQKRLRSTQTLHPKLERLRSRVWTRVKSGL